MVTSTLHVTPNWHTCKNARPSCGISLPKITADPRMFGQEGMIKRPVNNWLLIRQAEI